MDYRYFPDPDLLPLEISQTWIAEIKSGRVMHNGAPDVPEEMSKWLVSEYCLSLEDARALTADQHICLYFREVLAESKTERGRIEDIKQCANFVIGEFNKKRNEGDGRLDKIFVSQATTGRLLVKVRDGTISLKTARELFGKFWDEGKLSGGSPTPEGVDTQIDALGLRQLSDSIAIETMVDNVITANPKSVGEYKAGKEKALNALFGQVMKASNKTANPTQVTEILKRKLSS